MAARHRLQGGRGRQALAHEAARILAEHAAPSYLQAKRKAAERLRFSPDGPLPSDEEVEAALAEHQRLFQPAQAGDLRHHRAVALEAMRFFRAYRPRLVGSVLSGTADAYSTVHLHLFAPTPEEVLIRLVEHDIPFEEDSHRLTTSDGGEQDYPAFRFVVEDVPVEVVVFAEDGLRSPVVLRDGSPVRRASVKQVARLVEGG